MLALWVALAGAGEAHATHFRYGHYNWMPAGGNTIDFTLQNAWRRDGYSSCVDTVTLSSTPCTGPGGFPGVGDVIQEFIGLTTFQPGDSSTIGGPPGFFALLYRVTSIDPANNWLFASALDPNSLPGPPTDTLVTHTYGASGDYLGFTDSAARISGFSPPNSHINNPDGGYRVETRVNVGTQGANRSPVSALPPIVFCPINATCTFTVPATDPDGDTLTYRLSTSPEASSAGFVQPGPPHAPNAASISDSGVYTWDTTGATLADPGLNTLYSTQVTIEDRDGAGAVKSKVAVDFLIQLVQAVGSPPRFDQPPTPTCGSRQTVSVGGTLTFTVQASDPDTGDVVTLNVAGLPPGATMTPPLPTSGNPVSSVFSWTPAAAGTFVVTFTATDQTFQQALCSIIVEAGGVPPRPALDHFKCYGLAREDDDDDDDGGAAGPSVTLEDQFGSGDAAVGEARQLCTPVSKDGSTVNQEDAHLVKHTIEPMGRTFSTRRVEVTNQFGTHIVEVRKPAILAVPSSKSLSGDPGAPPTKLDHFQCYPVAGDDDDDDDGNSAFTPRSVELEDQFKTETVEVRAPVALCNPVQKTHEGEVTPIESDDEHLVCHAIKAAKFSSTATVRNQFGDAQLRLRRPETLCVPSEKRELPAPPPGEDDGDDDDD